MLLIIGVAVYTLAVLFFSESSSGRTLFASDQPPAVNYHSRDPYKLVVVEGSIQWTTIGWPRTTNIGVATKVQSDYGHGVSIAITGEARVSSATWNDQGIVITFDSGHTVFIPKSAFTGGR